MRVRFPPWALFKIKKLSNNLDYIVVMVISTEEQALKGLFFILIIDFTKQKC